MSTYYVPGIVLASGAWEGAKEKFPPWGEAVGVNVVSDSHRTLEARVIASLTSGESGGGVPKAPQPAGAGGPEGPDGGRGGRPLRFPAGTPPGSPHSTLVVA